MGKAENLIEILGRIVALCIRIRQVVFQWMLYRRIPYFKIIPCRHQRLYAASTAERMSKR